MACNAWNHPPSCSCDFRGGHDGVIGGWRNRVVPASTDPACDKYAWCRDGGRDSYTIPNARCPLCGASVFFYRSPHNGRVFFDQLGPPWPKHHCTDAYFTKTRNVFGTLGTQLNEQSPQLTPWETNGWQPLLKFDVNQLDELKIISGVCTEGISHHIGLRDNRNIDWNGPVQVRRMHDRSGRYIISALTCCKDNSVAPIVLTAYPEVRKLAELETWERAEAGDPQSQSVVGMLLSFDIVRKLKENLPDWYAANTWFKRSAGQGHWAGTHNLGMMALTGEGMPKDELIGFIFLRIAARERHPETLLRLAECYESGIGTLRRPQRACLLRAIASRIDRERLMLRNANANSARTVVVTRRRRLIATSSVHSV